MRPDLVKVRLHRHIGFSQRIQDRNLHPEMTRILDRIE